MSINNWLEVIRWNEEGLIPAIAQEVNTGRVLMLAWINREALQLTVQHNRAVYWSRSRRKLWFKGEESGHIQYVKDILLDCDNDVILLKVQQVEGIACHTGRPSCFYQQLNNGQWTITEAALKTPDVIYTSKKS